VGEIITIVGPSGSGKSTLFELITKELKPQKGSLEVQKLSEVFQDPYSSFHPSFSIINQIKEVASLDGLEVLLEETNLEYALLEKKPHELSGGQLQRASIIRALLMQPKLLLLDEPTSALDNVIALDVMKLLMKKRPTMGMLLITHDDALAQWCSDKIIHLSHL
jgi:peptide/nickel transport system ATP-binding protein